MLMTSQDIDPQAILDAIVRQQQAPETACAYLGTDPSEIRADLESLDQHWLETVRVSASTDGRILGAAVIEWDQELDRSWVYGPWMEEGTWLTAGPFALGGDGSGTGRRPRDVRRRPKPRHRAAGAGLRLADGGSQLRVSPRHARTVRGSGDPPGDPCG